AVAVVPDGVVDLALLEPRLSALSQERVRPLVSLMLADDATAVVQPVAEAARLVHQAGGLLHVDAVQAAGRIPCNINSLGADLMTLSGHKIGAPKGVGALVRRDAGLALDPLVTGGGQERGTRAGPGDGAGSAGFGGSRAGGGNEPPTRGARGAGEERGGGGGGGGVGGWGWGGRGAGRGGGGHLRRRGEPPAHHDAVGAPCHEGRNRRHRLRPRRGRGVVGRCLLVREGRPLACAC